MPKINYEKAYDALIVANGGEKTIYQISEDLGYSPTTLQTALRREMLSLSMLNLIELKYGIKYQDIEGDNKESDVDNAPSKKDAECIDEFQALVKNVTMDALRQVWEDQISYEVTLYIEGKLSEIKEQVVMALHNELV